jgi:hypothetical protein
VESIDKKAVVAVGRTSREFGDLVAITKAGRNALVWVAETYTNAVIEALLTLPKGQSIRAAQTDDGRSVTLINSTLKSGVETISFVLATHEGESGPHHTRNVLTIRADDAATLASYLEPFSPGGKVKVGDFSAPRQPGYAYPATGVKLSTLEGISDDGDDVGEPAGDGAGQTDARVSVASLLGAGAACPTCGHEGDDID